MKQKLSVGVRSLMFLGMSFLAEVASAQTTVSATNATKGWTTGLTNAQTNSGLPSGTLDAVIVNLMKWLLLILGAIAIIGFVISGIFYLTSAGEDDRIEKAKKGMTYSVVGVIVGLAGAVVILAIEKWLGGTDTAF